MWLLLMMPNNASNNNYNNIVVVSLCAGEKIKDASALAVVGEKIAPD